MAFLEHLLFTHKLFNFTYFFEKLGTETIIIESCVKANVKQPNLHR